MEAAPSQRTVPSLSMTSRSKIPLGVRLEVLDVELLFLASGVGHGKRLRCVFLPDMICQTPRISQGASYSRLFRLSFRPYL